MFIKVGRAASLFEHNPYVSLEEVGRYFRLHPNRVCGRSSTQFLADQLNLGEIDTTPEIYLTAPEVEGPFRDLLHVGAPVVAFNTFGTFHTNVYPIEQWQKVVDWCKGLGYCTIEIGDHGYVNRRPRTELLDVDIQLEGRTNLREVATVLRLSNLYVGVDTGLFHIAAGVGTPQVVLFRSDNSKLNGYRTTVPVEHHEPCAQNCHDSCAHPEGPCVSKIPPEEIIKAIESIKRW